jgi:TFIIF-interacting CTD phosphatase-like protein
MKKTLLLDIDYTLFDEMTPKPHLKEFIEKMYDKYEIHFYTAGSFKRVTEACRILLHTLGVNREIIHQLHRKSLHRENCKMIELSSGATVKCLLKASELLKVPIGDIIMLDDNPSYDNPHVNQVIQAEGFMSDMINDDYLLRVAL